MDLITYALLKKTSLSSGDLGSNAGVLTKLENNIKEVRTDIKEVQKNIDLLLPLATGAILAIQLGDQVFSPIENVLKLPLASGEIIGLVKSTPINSENSINKISVHTDGTMEVNSLSSDKLIAGEETLIFNSNHTNYF